MIERRTDFVRFDHELWFARRLKKHGVANIFAGTTDSQIRKQRFRAAIIERNLQDQYAAAFERLYHEKL